MKNLQKLKDQYNKLGEEIEKLESEGEYKGYGKRLKRYEDIPEREGYYIDMFSEIQTGQRYEGDDVDDQNVFPHKHQAEAVLALSQLLQLREEYIGEWQVDWKDEDQDKYCIEHVSGKISTNTYFGTQNILSFPIRQMRDDFMEDHKELIEEFGKIYI